MPLYNKGSANHHIASEGPKYAIIGIIPCVLNNVDECIFSMALIK